MLKISCHALTNHTLWGRRSSLEAELEGGVRPAVGSVEAEAQGKKSHVDGMAVAPQSMAAWWAMTTGPRIVTSPCT